MPVYFELSDSHNGINIERVLQGNELRKYAQDGIKMALNVTCL